jgi:hypothetical protein
MIVKSKATPSISNRARKYLNEYFFLKNTLFALILTFMVIILIAFGSIYSTKITKISHFIKNYDLRSYAKSFFVDYPRISLDLKYKDYQYLRYDRAQSLIKGIHIGNAEYVPGTIRENGTIAEYKAKFRIKGNTPEHWTDDNIWSLKIKMDGDNTLFGMKEFSIMHPARRAYLDEWYYHKFLKYSGLIFHRYDFVGVTINGKNMGVYAIDEGIEKRLIENNGLKDGPILSINDDLYWNDYAYMKKGSYNKAFWASMIEVINSNSVKKDSILKSLSISAIDLLESYRYGFLDAQEVFNLPAMAKSYAITDLFGYVHPLQYHNVRFYFNPITEKFEPIATDIYAIDQTSELCIRNILSKPPRENVTWEKGLFENREFIKEYIVALSEISSKKTLDKYSASIESDEQRMKSVLSKSIKTYMHYDFMNRNVLYKNGAFIQKLLNPTAIINANVNRKSSSSSQVALEMGNIQILPVEVSSIYLADSIIYEFEEKIYLPGRVGYKPVDYVSVEIPMEELPYNPLNSENLLKVNCNIVGLDRMYQVKVDRSVGGERISTEKPSDITQIKYFEVNEQEKSIIFKNGTWDVDEDLIIPKDYSVFATSGLRINLINHAMIKSYSPMYLSGKSDDPIIITSDDSTGQGLFILNNSVTSSLVNVYFSNLASPSKKGWGLTGAITFYDADVAITNCHFIDNMGGDDYLNVVRSEFTIQNSMFSNVISDAFDSDYSKGKILNTSFLNCGNDAIDISGTQLELQNILINGVQDKGLSAGEKSEISANHIEIINSELAITSKDNSKIHISNATLKNNQIGFVAFQKKSEFGPGHIVGTKIKMENVQIPYLIESKSSCTINGNIEASENEKVRNLLYGVKFGKSSK